jgi:hypothetical protein
MRSLCLKESENFIGARHFTASWVRKWRKVG